jgi:hypothetical protein
MISHFGVLLDGLRAAGAADLANVAGLFVAVVGIGFTLGQLVLLRRQLKLDALIRIMESNREIMAMGFEHPAVWAVMEGSTPPEVDAEILPQRRYLQLWMNHMQVMWMARRLGLVSGLEWTAYRQDMAESLRAPSLQAHWAEVFRTRFESHDSAGLHGRAFPARPHSRTACCHEIESGDYSRRWAGDYFQKPLSNVAGHSRGTTLYGTRT